jgi:phosphoadenosine phosphosulfate reductase
LHLVASQELQRRAPVIFIDTQDHFPETLAYSETLQRIFSLDLRVFRASQSIEEQHREWGAYWEEGAEGMKRHNRINKVEPFSRALLELDAHAWLTGARRAQSKSRSTMEPVETRGELLKYSVLYDWSDTQITDYMLTHQLPQHPLLAQGYTTIGDRHSTRRSSDVASADSARNLGYGRECGLQCEIKR